VASILSPDPAGTANSGFATRGSFVIAGRDADLRDVPR